MEGLTPEQLEYFKKKLLGKKTDIEAQLNVFAKKSDKARDEYATVFPQIDNDVTVGDAEEGAEEVTEYENNLGLERELEGNLVAINEALERITQGTYGICTNCNRLMTIERLEAMPEATLCIDCE
jgi:DnaK suppressor protein